MSRFFLPLIVFLLLAAFMASGLRRDPHEIPSPLIDRPAPAFSLPRLESDNAFSPDALRGTVWLLNVWASWCASCRVEHDLLLEMKGQVTLIGLNYKEVRGDMTLDYEKLPPGSETKHARERARLWLERHGDPYTLSVLDVTGRVGIDYGVYGVPETFVIDKSGFIRFKHTGLLTHEVLTQKIRPLMERLSQ